ncbi:MAG: hypothetical protein KA265_11530 [Piscinibacter sp.]|nr:hypothetical protein [Piscinibacter sp.]MBP6636072.1 hypothetical protein [Sulfuritalea sp.]
MEVRLELWHLILLLLAFFGAVWAFAQVFFNQVERRLDERFAGQETSRAEAATRWDAKFRELADGQRTERDNWQRLERELMQMRAEMPVQYVRHEDYVRNQSVIEAKLDALYAKIELMLVQGGKP